MYRVSNVTSDGPPHFIYPEAIHKTNDFSRLHRVRLHRNRSPASRRSWHTEKQLIASQRVLASTITLLNTLWGEAAAHVVQPLAESITHWIRAELQSPIPEVPTLFAQVGSSSPWDVVQAFHVLKRELRASLPTAVTLVRVPSSSWQGVTVYSLFQFIIHSLSSANDKEREVSSLSSSDVAGGTGRRKRGAHIKGAKPTTCEQLVDILQCRHKSLVLLIDDIERIPTDALKVLIALCYRLRSSESRVSVLFVFGLGLSTIRAVKSKWSPQMCLQTTSTGARLFSVRHVVRTFSDALMCHPKFTSLIPLPSPLLSALLDEVDETALSADFVRRRVETFVAVALSLCPTPAIFAPLLVARVGLRDVEKNTDDSITHPIYVLVGPKRQQRADASATSALRQDGLPVSISKTPDASQTSSSIQHRRPSTVLQDSPSYLFKALRKVYKELFKISDFSLQRPSLVRCTPLERQGASALLETQQKNGLLDITGSRIASEEKCINDLLLLWIQRFCTAWKQRLALSLLHRSGCIGNGKPLAHEILPEIGWELHLSSSLHAQQLLSSDEPLSERLQRNNLMTWCIQRLQTVEQLNGGYKACAKVFANFLKTRVWLLAEVHKAQWEAALLLSEVSKVRKATLLTSNRTSPLAFCGTPIDLHRCLVELHQITEPSLIGNAHGAEDGQSNDDQPCVTKDPVLTNSVEPPDPKLVLVKILQSLTLTPLHDLALWALDETENVAKKEEGPVSLVTTKHYVDVLRTIRKTILEAWKLSTSFLNPEPVETVKIMIGAPMSLDSFEPRFLLFNPTIRSYVSMAKKNALFWGDLQRLLTALPCSLYSPLREHQSPPILRLTQYFRVFCELCLGVITVPSKAATRMVRSNAELSLSPSSAASSRVVSSKVELLASKNPVPSSLVSCACASCLQTRFLIGIETLILLGVLSDPKRTGVRDPMQTAERPLTNVEMEDETHEGRDERHAPNSSAPLDPPLRVPVKTRSRSRARSYQPDAALNTTSCLAPALHHLSGKARSHQKPDGPIDAVPKTASSCTHTEPHQSSVSASARTIPALQQYYGPNPTGFDSLPWVQLLNNLSCRQLIYSSPVTTTDFPTEDVA